jgi:hypothetical protein
MRLLTRGLWVCLLAFATPDPAHAQWFVSPFIGGTLGGDTTHQSTAVGLSGGWMSRSGLGFAADLADAPDFFAQDGFLTSRRMTTLVGNLIVAIPLGTDSSFRPYISGGAGLLRPHLAEAGDLFVVQTNKLGLDVGGGLAAFLDTNVGIRGDIRYFRGLRKSAADTNAFGIDFSHFGFWRTSVGLVVRF